MVPEAQIGERASIPLASLLDETAFGATLLSPDPLETEADPPSLQRVRGRSITATIVIELSDPSPYLQGGELLLITGLGLSDRPAEVDAYIARVAASGVAALAFGIEPVYSEVPQPLIDACRKHGLPLVALPPPIYFASVTAYVNRALETERTRNLTAMNTVARRLTEAALQHRPAPRLLSVLAEGGDRWAVLQLDDEVLTAGEVPASVDTAELLDELQPRLSQQQRGRTTAQRSHLTAFTTVEHGGVVHEVTAHGIAPNRPRTRASERPATLLLGGAPRLTTLDRTALQLAANLMGLVVQLPVEQSMAVDQLLMHFMTTPARLTGAADQTRLSRLLANSLGSGAKSVRAVIALRNPDEAPRVGGSAAAAASAPRPGGDAAADREQVFPSDAIWLRRLLRTPFVEHRARRLRAFIAKAPTASELEQAAALGWLLAVSAPHPLTDLQEAMIEAEELALAARRVRRHVDGSDPASSDEAWPLSASDDAALTRAVASRWLEPLAGAERAEIRGVLHAWLQQHGSWDRTARTLGLHRNTVRRLVAEGQQLLGRDLDDPLERARILLALTALAPEE